MALKKYVVIPYLDSETNGFTTGNVYIGGFPGTATATETAPVPDSRWAADSVAATSVTVTGSAAMTKSPAGTPR